MFFYFGRTFAQLCVGSMSSFAAYVFGVRPAVAPRTLKLLEQKGFICREKDTEDRRIKRIRLTEYGRMQHPFLLSVMNSWVNYLIDTLSPQDVSCVERNFRILAERSSKADFRKLIGKMAR